MHIFLTGISGFSGFHLAKLLLEKGHSVTALTRKASNIKQNNQLQLIQDDLIDLTTLPSNIDVIIHTAATSPTSTTKMSHYINDNILGTKRLISLASQSGIQKFIFFSSLSIYGEINHSIVNELTPISNPNAYGISKYINELCLQEVAHQMPSLAIRLPAVIGLGASRHWLAKTLFLALNNEPITIYNPNSLFNNAIHINDLNIFIDQLLYHPLNGFDALTLASKNAMTIENIVKNILSSTHSSSEMIISDDHKNSFTISSEYAKKTYAYIDEDFKTILDLYLQEQVEYQKIIMTT